MIIYVRIQKVKRGCASKLRMERTTWTSTQALAKPHTCKVIHYAVPFGRLGTRCRQLQSWQVRTPVQRWPLTLLCTSFSSFNYNWYSSFSRSIIEASSWNSQVNTSRWIGTNRQLKWIGFNQSWYLWVGGFESRIFLENDFLRYGLVPSTI